MLPKTNLEGVEHPPGMSYNEGYIWELALLLEGKAACYEPLPTWTVDSVHFRLSKYLAWATRHSAAIQTSDIDNWISVVSLLCDKRKKMSTPSALFHTILLNEKQRYQISRPIYVRVEPSRATGLPGQSRASGQTFHLAKVFVRAAQGHSVSFPLWQ